MRNVTLRRVPKTRAEKAVKRFAGAVLLLSLIGSVPGIDLVGTLGERALADSGDPIVVQFYDSIDGNGDFVGYDRPRYMVCNECGQGNQEKKAVATIDIPTAGDYEVRADVWLNSVDEQLNESLYLTFGKGSQEFKPHDPNAGSFYVIEDKAGEEFSTNAYGGTFSLPEGSLKLNLFHYAKIWDEYPAFFNGEDQDGPESVSLLKIILIPKPQPFCRMEIEKTGTPDEVMPGDEITYTVKLKNTGTANCTGGGVELKEFYDTQTTFVSATPNPLQGNNLWNFDVVEPGEEHVVHIRVKASESADDGDELTNTACAWAEQSGPKSDDGNWVCDEVTTKVKLPLPSGECRLTVEKSDNPDPVMPGAELTYTVKLKNTGDIDCTGGGVELKEFYDAKTTFKSAQPAPLSGNTLWNFGTVEPEEEHTIVIKTEVGTSAQNGDILTNKACAWAEQFGSKSDQGNWVCDEETTTVIKLPPSTANLVITKQVTDANEGPADSNTASMGEQMTYTVTVENTGNAGAMDVVLTDNYDESKVTITDADGGNDDNTKIVYALGVINPSQSVTKEITATVKSGFTQNFSFDNIAEAAALSLPKVSDTVTTSVAVPPPGAPQLTLTKKVSDTNETLVETNTAARNESLTYTIEIANGGNASALDVVLTDDYDEASVGVTNDGGADTDNGAALGFSLGTITPGQTVTKQVVASVKPTLAHGHVFINRATILASNHATLTDVATTTVAVAPSFDLKLEKSVSPATIIVNQEATFTITVTNEGSLDGTDISVKDSMPPSLAYLSDSTDGDFNKDTGIWTIGSLPKGMSTSTSIMIRAGSSGIFENIAEIFTDGGQHDIDSTRNNQVATEDDQDSAVLKVNELPGPPGGCTGNCGGSTPFPRITIVKSVNKPQAIPGEIVTYTFTVSAGGTETAQNVQVTDTLPAGFTFIEGAGSVRTWNFGNLSAATSKTESYDVLVGSNVAPGSYENIVVATISNGVAPDNRSEARAKVDVRAGGGGGGPTGPQLTIQKDATVAFTNPGSQVIYNVTVKNIGGVAAKNVTVTDTLPAGFTFVDGGGATRVFTVGNLAAGEAHLIIYTAAVDATVPAGFHKNIATARADNATPVSDDADVEIRVVQVQGFTTLPDTGTGPLNPIAFALTSLLMLAVGAVMAYRYRSIFREAVRQRVSVNFIAQ